MNYVRITRSQRYNWVNGVRSVERNAERPRSLWGLQANPIPRPRRAPEEIEAARRLREERAEARRVAVARRVLAEREDEVREVARQLAAVEIAHAERVAAEHQSAVNAAHAVMENLRAVIREAELREAAIREIAEQQIGARPQMLDQACMANPFPAEDGDVFLAIPEPVQVAGYEMNGIQMDG